MKTLSVLACAGFMAIGFGAAASAQTAPPATAPGSGPYPLAAPHETVVINGVTCRTLLDQATNRRRVADCAEPLTTGSIPVQPGGMAPGAPVTGAGSPFPLAAPHEVVEMNGMVCRTELDQSTNTRSIVACAR